MCSLAICPGCKRPRTGRSRIVSSASSSHRPRNASSGASSVRGTCRPPREASRMYGNPDSGYCSTSEVVNRRARARDLPRVPTWQRSALCAATTPPAGATRSSRDSSESTEPESGEKRAQRTRSQNSFGLSMDSRYMAAYDSSLACGLWPEPSLRFETGCVGALR
jgi:hypothetical protein